MKILITGINGFVGSNLVQDLKNEHILYGLDIITPEIEGVRIGKHIRLFVEADSLESANSKVDEACKKMLANHID